MRSRLSAQLIAATVTCAVLSACSAHNSVVPNGSVMSPSRGTAIGSRNAPNVSNTWTLGAPAPIHQFTGAATSIGNDIYVLGGENHTMVFDENDIYDTTTNTWMKGRRMPTARTSLAAAAVNGLVYAIGGEIFTGTPVSTVEAYDPISNTWSTKASLPVAVASMKATVLNGLIYIVGGIVDSQGDVTTDVQVYDPNADSWSMAGPLLDPLAFAFVGTADGKIVAAEGYIGNGPTLSTELYDPGTNAWSFVRPAKLMRYGGCNGGIGDSVYAAGGIAFVLGGRFTSNRLDAYDVATNQWHKLASMPHGMIGPASATANGLLYCIGGSPFFGQAIFTNRVQIYTP